MYTLVGWQFKHDLIYLARWPNFGPLLAPQWMKIVVSNGLLENSSMNPLQTSCVHLFRELPILFNIGPRWPIFCSILQWPIMTQNGGFWPLPGKLIPESSSNYGCSFIWGVLKGYWVFSLVPDGSVGLSVGIQFAGGSVPETLGSNPPFSGGNQLVSSRFEYRLPVPDHRS